MTITDVHYDIAYHKIISCKNTTSYTSENLDNMRECSAFILDALNKINKKNVTIKNFNGEDTEIVIHIRDIIFHHNMLMVYAKALSRDYIKDYMSDMVKTWNDDHDIQKQNKRWRGLRYSSCGYGNAIVYSYDAHKIQL